MRVSIAQIAPVLLNRDQTLDRVVAAIDSAAGDGSKLVAFGESLVPGYPCWLSRLGGARFDDERNKSIHAMYLDQGVEIDGTSGRGHLDGVREACRANAAAAVVGVAERARDRGGHSLFCSAVTIAPTGEIASVHRKLVPTYEERLAWSHGDGQGLVAHRFLEPFTLGSLNCWENWMPLARAAMQAQGVDVHVAIWPGGDVNTRDITRFIARESRSYVLSASGLLRAEDVPDELPWKAELLADDQTAAGGVMHDGGSAVAGPSGEWIVEPVVGEERIITVEIDHERVRRERQNFDPAGHYSRPELLSLAVDRRRHRAAAFEDDS
ncbi:MAG: carbon-nitrogen hydrolase family protein [Planctomycetota bacterium]